jgi:hypothetical protein
MERIIAITLCLAAVACGASTDSHKEKPDKELSDEAFLAKLSAQAANQKVPEKAPAVTQAASPIFSIFQAKVTTATFDAVYRAAKSVQGATASGVTYVKYGELLQTFSTELEIAKDHELNTSDKKLLQLFQEAYVAFHDSHTVWAAKVEHGAVLSGEETPVTKGIMQGYGITPYASTGNWNADLAMQMIWITANSRLESATAFYYGKQIPPAQVAAERATAERAVKITDLRERIASGERLIETLHKAGKSSTFLTEQVRTNKQLLQSELQQ